jgi:flagellum-specific peptidoglycan hydrolase FlgJ
LALKLRGMGDDVWKAGLAELDGKIAMARLGRMIEADPLRAEQWYGEHKESFLGADRGKAEDAIKKALVEQTVGRVWDAYGIDEREGTEAIENDEKLDFDQKNRARAIYQARVSDENRFAEREEREWFGATRDAVANAGSLERAMAAIDYSNADGYGRQQMIGLARQMYAPEKFQEKLEDWHQAYREITAGRIRTAEDFLYRWNGVLSTNSMKTFLKTFYDADGSGSAGVRKTYVGDETAQNLKAAMDGLGLKEGSPQRPLFLTAFGEETAAQEAKLKRSLSPLEKYSIIESLARQQALKTRDAFDIETEYGQTIRIPERNAQMPGFLVRMAQRSGFTFNPDLAGFYRTAPDGTVEKFDTEKIYPPSAMRPSQAEPEEPAPYSQPRPEAPDTEPDEVAAGPRGPKRMPDGRVIGQRTGKKNTSSSTTGQAFLEEIKPGVVDVAKRIDVPPSVLAAQALLESGWGKSRIGNNIFGVKAGKSWTGATKTASTHEVVNGKRVKIDATFRDYDSISESIEDLGNVLSGDRYASVRGATGYAEAARALQAAGYATDEDYAQKLIAIIENYKLYELDEKA